MPNFRISKKPSRTCTKRYRNYRYYKEYLKSDFNDRCGYCDTWDEWFRGSDFYQIDHFAPQSRFDSLESEYSNLVYSCPYCNRAKGDDWVTPDNPNISHNGEIGYIDLCDVEYDQLFYRLENGEIKAHTSIGEYMYNKLKFYLTRHKVIWNLTRLYMLCNKLMSMLDDPDISAEYKKKLDERYSELSKYLHKYLYLAHGKFE
jgi:hypothetical protein